MVHFFARSLMVFAVINMVFTSVSPAFAAKKVEPNMRKIDRCLKDIERDPSKVRGLPPIMKEAAVRTCWVTEDSRSARALMRSLSVDAIKRAERDVNRIQIQQGFDGRARLEEPGMLGLDGAEEVLSVLLIQEAVNLWALAAAVGGPAIPLEKPTNQTGTIQGADGANIQFQFSEGNSGQRNFAEQYVDAHIKALKGDPDSAIALKARMYEALKSIALKSANKRSADEKRFLASFEAYLREQYVRMIDTAIQKQEEFETSQDTNSLASAYTGSFGAAPPDLFDHMGAAAVLGTYGAAVASMIAGASSFAAAGAASVSAAASAAAATAASTASATMASLAASGASSATITAAATSLTATAASSVGAATSSASAAASLSTGVLSAGGATIAGPVLVVVGAVLTGILGTKQVVQRINIEKRLNDMKTWKKSGRINATALLGTREGTIQFQHFYAKATSSSSPTGYVNPADTCQACFYADKDYKGEKVCTDGRINDLRAALVNGEPTKMQNKISSVGLVQESCPDSFAVVYDKTKLSGNRHIIRSSIADLSAFSRSGKKSWDDAASSIAFSNKNAPKCEICLFTDKSYGGGKFCTSSPIGALTSVKMADKVSSVLMNTKDCPKAKAWLYRKKDFELRANGSGVTEITESVQALPKGVNNSTSSLYFSADGSNPNEVKASGGCRACMYDLADHKGEYMCVNSNIPDMNNYRIAGETFRFANQASSIQFIRDECKRTDALELEIYTKSNYRGNVFRFYGNDVNDLKGIANNQASSVKLNRYDGSQTCRVCTYSEKNYHGEKKCFDADTATLPSELNNKISSIRLENFACQKAGAILFDSNNYDGKALDITKSYSDLSQERKGSGNWNNAVSSLRFHKDYATAKAKAEEVVKEALNVQEVDTSKLCEICIYKDKNFKGEKQCITGNAGSFSGTLNNSVSSLKINKGACSAGGAILYKDKNFGGNTAPVLKSISDMSSLPGVKGNWNNNISSLKFNKNLRGDLFNSFRINPVLRALNDNQINDMITETYGK